VKAFLDTSVLVASAREQDGRHEASLSLLNLCKPQQASCAAHTLVELYATLTGMQPPNRFQPKQALLFLNGVKARLECITLTAEEVFQAVERTAGLQLPGGIIYDALIMACARKAGAERIYTWNARHFQMVAPDLAERIVAP
jgi:predicted nucleic acid-binding protein